MHAGPYPAPRDQSEVYSDYSERPPKTLDSGQSLFPDAGPARNISPKSQSCILPRSKYSITNIVHSKPVLMAPRHSSKLATIGNVSLWCLAWACSVACCSMSSHHNSYKIHAVHKCSKKVHALTSKPRRANAKRLPNVNFKLDQSGCELGAPGYATWQTPEPSSAAADPGLATTCASRNAAERIATTCIAGAAAAALATAAPLPKPLRQTPSCPWTPSRPR